MKTKTTNLREISTKIASPTRYLIDAKALKEALEEEFALYAGMGAAMEHFAPAATLLNDTLTPEEKQTPSLNGFVTWLDAVVAKIERGEWK